MIKFFRFLFFPILFILYLVYKTGVKIRNYGYDKRYIQSKKLNIPVISIGNITLGGSGKTPITILLTNKLKEINKATAILTRGYGRESTDIVIVDSNTEFKEAGDEPLLISKKTNSPVIVHKNRFFAATEYLKEKNKIDLFILDDGFQHRNLHRNFDVLLVDSTKPLYGKMLPLGYFREPLKPALKRSDAIIVTGFNSTEIFKRQAELKRLGNKKVFTCLKKPGQIEDSKGNYKELKEIKDKKIFIFSGLANNNSFSGFFRGYNIVAKAEFKDHYIYSDSDISAISKIQCDYLITTEKDFVKLSSKLENLWVLKMELDFSKINNFVDLLKEKTKI